MKKPKEKRDVKITCTDRTVLRGIVHVDEGLRVLDFFNLPGRKFIALTEVHGKKKNTLILNKESVKWLEDLGKHE